MHYSYPCQGTCSQQVDFDIDEGGNLHNVSFVGGCDGNLKAIGKLVEGRPAVSVAALLKGNLCGMKLTSCGDQLAQAIEYSL
ncbi:MAG: TIGR03905 family TSCPD domain-containing protein [Coriobacteriales bacterium]|nr:TIGR03905 family TSCPD domain-containing protein [Coriobacteriales bacterium]